MRCCTSQKTWLVSHSSFDHFTGCILISLSLRDLGVSLVRAHERQKCVRVFGVQEIRVFGVQEIRRAGARKEARSRAAGGGCEFTEAVQGEAQQYGLLTVVPNAEKYCIVSAI